MPVIGVENFKAKDYQSGGINLTFDMSKLLFVETTTHRSVYKATNGC
jgi:hypothetical protein